MSTHAASNATHEADVVGNNLHEKLPANTSSVKGLQQFEALCSM